MPWQYVYCRSSLFSFAISSEMLFKTVVEQPYADGVLAGTTASYAVAFSWQIRQGLCILGITSSWSQKARSIRLVRGGKFGLMQ
jgi:hypothetical protein